MADVGEVLRAVWGRVMGPAEVAQPLPQVEAVLDGAAAIERAEASLASHLVQGKDGRSALASAIGLSSSGVRVAAFVDSAGLAAAQDLVALAARRHLPMVVHLAARSTGGPGAPAGTGHEAWHQITEAGAVQFFAASVQDAIDLTLLARRVAEEALVPAIVAADWDEVVRTLQNARLPGPELVAALVGGADDAVDAPTPAQRMLFGAARRRVPRAFDVDRPTLQGAHFGPDVAGLAAAGQAPFFTDHLPALLDRALVELERLSGRAQRRALEHRVDGAEVVFVAEGAAFESAAAVADHLRSMKRVRAGAIGIRCLRPFPTDEIRSLVGRAQRVIVLERVTTGLAEPPLTREIRGALARGGAPAQIRTALYGSGGANVPAAALAQIGGSTEAATVHLGARFLPPSTGYPKRQAMLDELRRAYPNVGALGLPDAPPLRLAPEGAVVVAVHRIAGRGGEAVLGALAPALHATLGGAVRARPAIDGGLWGAPAADRLVRAPAPFVDCADAEADAAVACEPVGSTAVLAARDLRSGGALVLSSTLADEELARSLPAAALKIIREKGLSLLRAPSGDDACAGALAAAMGKVGHALARRKLVSAARELFGDARAEAFGAGYDALAPLASADAEAQARPFADASLPPALEEIRPRDRQVATALDSLPRLWDEVGALYANGDVAELSVDPYLAAGAIAPLSGALRDRSGLGALLPAFEPAKCSGCTACWRACPEGAVAPLVLGAGALIEAGIDLARRSGSDAEPLRAMVGKLGPKVNAHLKASAAAPSAFGALLRESCAEMLEKASMAEERKRAILSAFDAAATALADLPVSRTRPFFDDPERERAGDGELLTLAIDPRACKGCGACVAACADGALTSAPATPERLRAAHGAWTTWQALPDTRGTTIARARQHEAVRDLGALLLSRHCLFSMVGGDSVEMGSGARTSLRLMFAAAEFQLQRRVQAQAEAIAELQKKVADKVRESLVAALPATDLDALAGGLDAAKQSAVTLSELVDRIPEAGASVDVSRARRLVEAGRQLADLYGRLTSGAFGLGRSRTGLVLEAGPLTEGLAVYPYNPFAVPAIVDDTGEAAAVARGALEGQVQLAIAGVAGIRRAKLELENPTRAALSDEELSRLSWSDLSADERAAVPPMLLVAPSGAIGDRALAEATAGDLPVKVILLSDGDDRTALEVLSLGLSRPDVFVAQSSLADAAHLGNALLRAFEHPGPAILQLHAPSPGLHGFAADRAVAQAKRAVDARAFPLFVLEPAEEDGAFGTRLWLDGNPSPDAIWASPDGSPLTPADWALTEKRFARWLTPLSAGAPSPVRIDEYLALPPSRRAGSTPFVAEGDARWEVAPALVAWCERRRDAWRVLQELSGRVTPFTARVQTEAKAAVAAEHANELAALRAEQEARMQSLRADQAAEMKDRLAERLLALARQKVNGHARGRE